MAFKQRWYCEHCNHMILSVEEPEEWDCPNYDDEQINASLERDEEEDYPKCPKCDKLNIHCLCKESQSGHWGKDERNERYRIAYHIRGGTWEGTTAYMYTGLLLKGQVLMDEAKRGNRKELLKLALIREAEYEKDKS